MADWEWIVQLDLSCTSLALTSSMTHHGRESHLPGVTVYTSCHFQSYPMVYDDLKTRYVDWQLAEWPTQLSGLVSRVMLVCGRIKRRSCQLYGQLHSNYRQLAPASGRSGRQRPLASSPPSPGSRPPCCRPTDVPAGTVRRDGGQRIRREARKRHTHTHTYSA